MLVLFFVPLLRNKTFDMSQVSRLNSLRICDKYCENSVNTVVFVNPLILLYSMSTIGSQEQNETLELTNNCYSPNASQWQKKSDVDATYKTAGGLYCDLLAIKQNPWPIWFSQNDSLFACEAQKWKSVYRYSCWDTYSILANLEFLVVLRILRLIIWA